jgi:unsaturated rhamnogalacturonyl hydrolase
MMFFLLVLLFIVFVIVIIDWIPLFSTWQSRIKMGQFASVDEWKSKVLQTSLQWLHQTPTIKVSDNTRVIVIDMLRGNYKRTAIQSWQQGALLLGLTNYVNQTNDVKISKEIASFLASKLDANGNWKIQPKEVDEVLLAFAISKTHNFDFQKYQPALDATFDLITKLIGTDQTVAYRMHYKNYRLVDTIGFICPFLVRYGLQFENKNAIDLALNQIREFNTYAILKTNYIPCHSYDIHSKLPIGLFGWGRGLGWYAIGVMDSWLELPNEHPNKNELTQMVIELAKTAIQFQNENGSWSWLIMSSEKQNDSSTTAILSWFLTNASAIPEIETACNAGTVKALNYLQKVTRRSGAIDFSQGDTKGVGVYSQKFDVLPFTQGFCLRTLFTNFNTID